MRSSGVAASIPDSQSGGRGFESHLEYSMKRVGEVWPSRRPHKPKILGSNPRPATIFAPGPEHQHAGPGALSWGCSSTGESTGFLPRGLGVRLPSPSPNHGDHSSTVEHRLVASGVTVRSRLVSPFT